MPDQWAQIPAGAPTWRGGADQFRDALTTHTAHTDCRNGQKWLTASNGLHTPGNGTRSGARSQHCKTSIASRFMSAYAVIRCTHAILSQFLSFHFTFQPFPIPISPCSLPFYMYFTYTKYCICYTVYTYIWCVHIYVALLLSQAAAVSCCKEFSTRARKSVAVLKDPYCMYRNTPLVMGTSTSAPTAGCKCRGLHLKRFWLCLCAHILCYFECMRIFPSELTL